MLLHSRIYSGNCVATVWRLCGDCMPTAIVSKCRNKGLKTSILPPVYVSVASLSGIGIDTTDIGANILRRQTRKDYLTECAGHLRPNGALKAALYV